MTSLAQAVERTRGSRAPIKGILLVAVSAIFFGLMPVFTRSVAGFSTAAIVFYRALFSLLTIAAVVVASPAVRAQLRLRRLSRRTLLLLLGLGLAMACGSVLYFFALSRTTVAKSMLLCYAAPVYVALLEPLLLHERRTRWTWPAVGLGFAGILLIVDPGRLGTLRPGELVGVIAAFGSGIGLAGIFLFGRALHGQAPMLRTLACAVVMLVLFLPWGVGAPPALFLRNLPFLAGLGVVCHAVAYLLLFKGQTLVNAQVSSTVSLLEPVCGVALGYVVYGEALGPLGLAGGVAILLSIWLASK